MTTLEMDRVLDEPGRQLGSGRRQPQGDWLGLLDTDLHFPTLGIGHGQLPKGSLACRE